MDPITIITIVFGAVSSLITAFELLEQIRKRKAEAGHNGQKEPEPTAAARLSNFANRLSSRLSRNGPSVIDKKLAKDIFELRKELADLLKELHTFSTSETSNLHGSKEESAQALAKIDDRTLSSWSMTAMRLKERMEKMLTRSNDDGDKTGLEIIPLGPNGALSNRQFCDGAILCQHGMADSTSLAIEGPTSNPPMSPREFSCIRCNLRIGHYESVGVSRKGSPLKTSELLTACHLMACDSNLRAFYRCLACHLDQKQVDFYTAAGLEAHMEQHPGFSFLPPKLEDAGEQAAKQDMKQFLTGDVQISQSSTDQQSSHSEECDTPSLSSLGSSASENRSVAVDSLMTETAILSPRPAVSPAMSMFPPHHPSYDAGTPLGNSSLGSSNNDQPNAPVNPPPVPRPRRQPPEIPSAERQTMSGDFVQALSSRPPAMVPQYMPGGDRPSMANLTMDSSNSSSMNRSAAPTRNVPQANMNAREAYPGASGAAARFNQPFIPDATTASRIFNPSTYGVQDSYRSGTSRD